MNSSPISGYNRALIDDLQHITSVCLDCETVIIGSAANGLAEAEAIHKEACQKHKTHPLSLAPPLPQHASKPGEDIGSEVHGQRGPVFRVEHVEAK
jgi:hypothetical protein